MLGINRVVDEYQIGQEDDCWNYASYRSVPLKLENLSLRIWKICESYECVDVWDGSIHCTKLKW